MNFLISDSAKNWYLRELNPKENDCIRFFVQYGGHSGIQKGFSLGIRIDIPINPGVLISTGNINFYIEEDDLWFFDNHDVSVTLLENDEYPQMNYIKKES